MNKKEHPQLLSNGFQDGTNPASIEARRDTLKNERRMTEAGREPFKTDRKITDAGREPLKSDRKPIEIGKESHRFDKKGTLSRSVSTA